MSFSKLSTLAVDGCVLAHGGLVYDVVTIAENHRLKITEIKDAILDILRDQPLSIDELTQYVMKKYGIGNTIVSFTLTQTTVRTYVTYLESEKMATLMVSDGLLRVSVV